MKNENYRFVLGSLYKYDEESNAYIHVWKSADANTKAKAIRRYENYVSVNFVPVYDRYGED